MVRSWEGGGYVSTPALLGPVAPLLPVLGHDVLAVHGVVEAIPGVNVPGKVLQLVPIGRQNPLKRMADNHEAECVLRKGFYGKMLTIVFSLAHLHNFVAVLLWVVVPQHFVDFLEIQRE